MWQDESVETMLGSLHAELCDVSSELYGLEQHLCQKEITEHFSHGETWLPTYDIVRGIHKALLRVIRRMNGTANQIANANSTSAQVLWPVEPIEGGRGAAAEGVSPTAPPESEDQRCTSGRTGPPDVCRRGPTLESLFDGLVDTVDRVRFLNEVGGTTPDAPHTGGDA